MIKAVAFDVDDTLCLTEAVCFELENEALATMGRPPMTREAHIATWGHPLFDAILVRSPGVNVKAFEAAFHPVVERYIAEGKLDVIPDANFEALDALIARGKKVMLLTSRTHPELKHMLEPDHLLASRISAFYHKDNTDHHKPDPRVFNNMLQEHGLRPDECAYVGDSVGDAVAATQAGLYFIASLESGLRKHEDFADYPVAAFIESLPDVVGVIRALDAQPSPSRT